MARRLFAWLFNKDLVYVQFAYGHSLRVVWNDAYRNKYVRLYGETYRLDSRHRQVIWVRMKKN